MTFKIPFHGKGFFSVKNVHNLAIQRACWGGVGVLPPAVNQPGVKLSHTSIKSLSQE